MRFPICLQSQRLRIVALTVALAGALPSTWAQGGPQVPDRAHDSYAIYSLLVPGDVLARMDSSQQQRWAIAATTVNADDMNPALAPDAALKPPAKHPKDFEEAVADYYQRKNQRTALTRNFSLDKPYALLSTAEAQEFRASRASMHSNSAIQSKYSGYPGITYFSEVYYNASHTAALVYVLDWCGNLCAQGEWVYLEKGDGGWVRRSGTKS